MIIYIDTDYKCHTSPGEGLTAVETDAFNGKCRQYIEGYRFVPNGGIWVRDDGEVFVVVGVLNLNYCLVENN